MYRPPPLLINVDEKIALSLLHRRNKPCDTYLQYHVADEQAHPLPDESDKMFDCSQLALIASTTIRASMKRWRNARLEDDEPELVNALQTLIDLSGGLRWIESHKKILIPMQAPDRAGEFSSFDWERYDRELHVPYQGFDLYLDPSYAEVLLKNVV